MKKRILAYQAFLKHWSIFFGLFLILIFLFIVSGFFLFTDNWPALTRNALLIPFLIGIWSFLSSWKLKLYMTPPLYEARLQQFRTKQKVRQIIWGTLLVVGICLAVFAATREWDSTYLYIGLGLGLPSSICYLAELGLGLQSDWLLHSLWQKV